MVYYPKKDYKLLNFQISTNKNKKYDAILENKINKKIVKVSFGDIRYMQYYDKLNEYSNLNHLDEKRRKLYISRHKNDINKPYSASWFSLNYLW